MRLQEALEKFVHVVVGKPQLDGVGWDGRALPPGFRRDQSVLEIYDKHIASWNHRPLLDSRYFDTENKFGNSYSGDRLIVELLARLWRQYLPLSDDTRLAVLDITQARSLARYQSEEAGSPGLSRFLGQVYGHAFDITLASRELIFHEQTQWKNLLSIDPGIEAQWNLKVAGGVQPFRLAETLPSGHYDLIFCRHYEETERFIQQGSIHSDLRSGLHQVLRVGGLAVLCAEGKEPVFYYKDGEDRLNFPPRQQYPGRGRLALSA